MKIIGKAVVSALTAVLLAPAAAHAEGFAAGVSAGTPGLGVSVAAQVNEMLVVRGAVDGLSINRNEEYSDIDYDGKAKLMTGGLFADVHPGGGPFFVSGGAYFGKRRIELDATPTASVDIGGQTFTPAQVGRLNGVAKLSKVQPFAGLGFDNSFTSENKWGFRVLAGVSFSKKPQVDLTAVGGLLASDATFLSRLAQEEAQAEDDAKDFKYFPVLQVGITRRF